MATIKLDGREIPFEQGQTIIEAAHRAGIDIPHYCWHPGLSLVANCRMCLVEIAPPPGRPAMMLDVLRLDREKGEYVVEQKPKLQPACQVACADGMDIKSDTSEHVVQARAAVQELMLLNHPVDCPICDQAGECKLQDYWLAHQRTGKRMHQEIAHKPKAMVFGPTIVYDAERCISCTRCIRFSREIAGDAVLSMRERGNLKEVNVSPGRELDHDYSLMTEHVCPVGALTSAHFRFKARVWFLRAGRTICQGCATGCNAFLDYDPRDNTPYRYRPRDNPAVNRYWMCDPGMLSYPEAHTGRLLTALVGSEDATINEALEAAKKQLQGCEKEPDRIAILLSAQHSNEDNFALATFAREHLGTNHFYMAGRPAGRGDDVLMSADKNPNTAGCHWVAAPDRVRPFSELVEQLKEDRYRYAISLGADVDVDVTEAKTELKRLKGFVAIASHDGPLPKAAHIALPACSWVEVPGTFVNRQGIPQAADGILRPRGDARPGWYFLALLGRVLGYSTWSKLAELETAMAGHAQKVAETVANSGAQAPAEASA